MVSMVILKDNKQVNEIGISPFVEILPVSFGSFLFVKNFFIPSVHKVGSFVFWTMIFLSVTSLKSALY